MKFKPTPPIPENSRLKTLATGTAEVFKLDPRSLSRAPGFNTRYDFGDIAALAADIEANGVLEALKVRKDGKKIFLVNGHRRLTAIELLIKENRWPADPTRPGFPMPVPCTSEGKNVSPTDRIFMMLSLNTGKPFNLLEKGVAYTRILDADKAISAAEVARRTGETKQAVSNAVTLVRKSSPRLIEFIKQDILAPTTVLEIAKAHHDHSAQDQAAADAIAAATSNGRSHATPKDLPKDPSLHRVAHASSVPPPDPSDPSDSCPPPFIADLSTEDPSLQGVAHASSVPPAASCGRILNPDAPADPTAFERLRNAPATNRDGSSGTGPSGGPGEGYATCDKRLAKIETLLDELGPADCNQDRWNTIELILDYLKGNYTIATLRTHLTEESTKS